MMITNAKYTPFIYLAVFAIIVWVVWLLMRRLGLIKDAAEKMEDQMIAENVQALNSTDLFNPMTYRDGSVYNTSLASNATVKEWADRIYDAWGDFWGEYGFWETVNPMNWGDNESQVYAVFREMSNKLNVSQLADAYKQLYNRDLLADIQSNFNNEEMAKVWGIIKKLP